MSEVDLIKKRLLPNSIRIPLIKTIIEAAVSHSTAFENILIRHEMLSCVVLCCIVLYCVVLCCVVLCCVVLCCISSCLDEH